MWNLIFITSLSEWLYQTTTLLISYYKYGVTISIEKIEESPATIPAVTICNINSFKIERFLEYFMLKENLTFENYSVLSESVFKKEAARFLRV